MTSTNLRNPKAPKETRYMVKTLAHSQQGSLCTIDEDGILWIANTGRKSLTRNPTVFKSKSDIKRAIKKSKAYAESKGYAWKDAEYEILPVTIKL